MLPVPNILFWRTRTFNLLETSMTSQQLEEYSQPLEARVKALEGELTQVKQILSSFLQQESPWWRKISGSFENDPTFDEAVRFGQEWRKSAE